MMFHLQLHRYQTRLCSAAFYLLFIMGLMLGVDVRPAQAQIVPAASTPTPINGLISTDTTWYAAQSPYRMTGHVRIASGATLTIEPGVVVEGVDGIIVDGSLIAEGTAAAPIVFTSVNQSPSIWSGITAGLAARSNLDMAPARLVLRHVTVEYGGVANSTQGGNLSIYAAAVTVENSTFRHSGRNGIHVSLTPRTTLEIRDSTFVDNELAALLLGGMLEQQPVLSNLTAEDNGVNAVVYQGVSLAAGSHLLVKSGLPYHFRDGFLIRPEGQLVVQPGVEIQVATSFTVQGEMAALGSADEPIRFTRIDQGPNWLGLKIASDPYRQAKAEFDHVIIEYGGRAENVPGVVPANLLVDSAVVTLTNSIVRNGDGSGIVSQRSLPYKDHAVHVAGAQISGHAGSAIRCQAKESCNFTLQNLTTSGNGFDGIAHDRQTWGDQIWRNFGLPYLIEGQGGVSGGTLFIEPGTELRFAQGAQFRVSGDLVAIGMPAQPITFTGSVAEPGWWQGIHVDGSQASVVLRYCDIGYGGASVNDTSSALLYLAAQEATVTACRFHDGTGLAMVTAGTAQPVIRHNSFENNAFGVQNSLPEQVNIDARYNWWGAVNGPQHASNPDGTGAPVSDGVRFDPWLTSPHDATGAGSDEPGLSVRLSGPHAFFPGQELQFAVFFANYSTDALQDALLRVALPANADYVDSTDGIFWPERRQVFWKLGELAPGTIEVVALRVRYEWGLPSGLHTSIAAQLSGSNISPQPFDLTAYLEYQPRFVTGQVELDEGQVAAERAANAEMDALYAQATSEGYRFGSALQQSYNTGEVVKQAILLNFDPHTKRVNAFVLWWQADRASGIYVDGSSFTVAKASGALRYDIQSDQWQEVSQTAMAGQASAAPVSWDQCMLNCIEDKLPGYILKKYVKILGTISKAIKCVAAASGDSDAILDCSKLLAKSIPGYGEAVDLGKCNSDCQECVQGGQGCNDDRCYCCTEDKERCSSDDWLYGTLGREVIKKRVCNTQAGKYLAEQVTRVCGDCEKCVDGGNGLYCSPENKGLLMYATAGQLQPATAELALSSGESSQRCLECVVAKDPNALHGPEGDLLPGQLLTYTVEYENVGEGQAFGVFIVNELSEHFDVATLELPENAYFSPAARTIFFQIGELAPAGQADAKGQVTYSVRLKRDLPSGTIITNQAVVHFPSVPEETPTNTRVNVVQPIRVPSLALQTGFEQPVSLTLQGEEVSNLPLTFVIVDGPRYGTLAGTAPHLTYHPAPGFTGVDYFTVSASNGTTTSRPAEVNIEVRPADNDHEAPRLHWTAPADGAVVPASVNLGTDSDSLYTPRLQLQFSEPMDASTVTSATIEIQAPDGHLLPLHVAYDSSLDQALVLLREEPQSGVTYMVTVKNTAQDLAGNGLAGDVRWTFQVGAEAVAQQAQLYLPATRK